MLLSKAWKLYEADKRLLGYSLHTLKAYQLQSNLLIRHIGDVETEEVTHVALKEYLIKQDHLKPASIGHRIKFIRAFFRYLHEEGFIERNVSSKLKEPKQGARIPKALNTEEVELLRDACSSSLEKALTEFFYATGCRIGEVFGLNIKDINWQTRSALVIGKGNKQREVYFTERCRIWLQKYLQSRTDEHEALFVTVRKPIRRMSIARIREIVKDIAKHSEVEVNVYPHRWRHTTATTMLENGAPLHVIMSSMGHARPSTTMIYAQLSGERRRQEYNKYFR